MNTQTNCTSRTPAPLFVCSAFLCCVGFLSFFVVAFALVDHHHHPFHPNVASWKDHRVRLYWSGKKVSPYILLSDEIWEQQVVAVSSHFSFCKKKKKEFKIQHPSDPSKFYTMLWWLFLSMMSTGERISFRMGGGGRQVFVLGLKRSET